MNITLLSLTLCSLFLDTAHAAQSYAGQTIGVEKITAQTSNLTRTTVQSGFIAKVNPGSAAIVLISKSPTAVSIAAYADSSSKKQMTFTGAATTNNMITLQPNEVVKLTASQGQDYYLQLHGTAAGNNWLRPEKGSVYGIYFNRAGLVPGLLKRPIIQKRTPTDWNKICAMEIFGSNDLKSMSTLDSLVLNTVNVLDEVMRFQQSTPRT